MRELKVGDRVRVRSDEGAVWVDDMLEYCGTEQVVEEITESGNVLLKSCYESCDENSRSYWIFEKYDLTLIEESKNYIAEFMKDNGLEIGERFGIRKEEYTAYIDDEYRLINEDGDEIYWYTLCEILRGNIKPIKLESQVDGDKVEKGALIEVSDNEKVWYEEVFVVAHNDLYFCENPCNGQLYGWKYARPLK